MTHGVRFLSGTRGADNRVGSDSVSSAARGGYLRRITVFVRHENVVRLLEFMGYRLE